MAIKRAEYMSVESAENFILQHEDSAKRLYSRYLKTVKERKKVFEKHKELQAEGYKRLSKAVDYASKGFSPESLSYLAYTLASSQTSYTYFLSIRKRTFDTLNATFSDRKLNKKTGEYRTTKKFLKNYKEFEEFTEFMELVRNMKIDNMYSSYQLINEVNSIIQETSKKESWSELKERLANTSDRMREAVIIFMGNKVGEK